MQNRIGKMMMLVAVMVAVLGLASRAYAGSSVAFTLTPTTANTSATDAGGSWEYQSGTVATNGFAFGTYAVILRVSSGSSAYNAAAQTLTIFAGGTNNPPESITMQGVQSYNNGISTGSVSATSPAFKKLQKKSYVWDYGAHTLTFK